MTGRPDTQDYHALFLADAPLMDMRAPAEFAHGAFPTATSLPLMTDDERAQVGICYKQRGQAAAIELGHRLVSGEIRARRLAGWCDFARAHPEGFLYCFRGGLRSQTVQRWLRDEGIDYPLVVGGYKAMRRFLLEALERSVQAAELVLVSGRTGTGKTRVIERIERSVDLEALARHRGSTFGQLLAAQPSQIDFENALSIALLRLLQQGGRRVYLEDEGRLIGRVALPQNLRDRMRSAPMVLVEESLAERIDVVLEDYVCDLGRRYVAAGGQEGPALHRERLQGDLARIRRRLGGARHAEVSRLLDAAFDRQWRTGSLEGHRAWIAYLLERYYDPMYDYQLARREGARLFRGSRDEVVAWVAAQG